MRLKWLYRSEGCTQERTRVTTGLLCSWMRNWPRRLAVTTGDIITGFYMILHRMGMPVSESSLPRRHRVDHNDVSQMPKHLIRTPHRIESGQGVVQEHQVRLRLPTPHLKSQRRPRELLLFVLLQNAVEPTD